MGHGIMECSSGMGRAPTLELTGTKMQRATFHQGHKEPPAPSPPRAIASLSVRVLGQPDRQGLPPTIPRTHEKAGTAPSEPGSAHPILHLSRSARVSAGGRANEDSDEDESDDDESEDDEDWGPGPGGAQRGNRAPPQPKKLPPSVPTTFARSKRKLQPPQHIPPPQAHHTPMQLRHPTPPPSPPPDLFPLPDTPKQSPPDEQESPEARGPSAVPFPPPTMQRQESDSSSRSSSPEPPVKRRPGPLSRLVHKMESEGAFHAVEASSAVDLSGETVHSNAGPASSSKSPPQQVERRSLQKNQDTKEEKESEQGKIEEQPREKKFLEEEKERERKRLQEEKKLRQKEEQEKERKQQEEVNEKERKHEEEKERERKHQEEEKEKERRRQEEDKDKGRPRNNEEKRRGEKLQKAVTEAQDSDSSSGSDSKSDSSRSSRSSSSSSSQGKNIPARQLKVSYQKYLGG